MKIFKIVSCSESVNIPSYDNYARPPEGRQKPVHTENMITKYMNTSNTKQEYISGHRISASCNNGVLYGEASPLYTKYLEHISGKNEINIQHKTHNMMIGGPSRKNKSIIMQRENPKNINCTTFSMAPKQNKKSYRSHSRFAHKRYDFDNIDDNADFMENDYLDYIDELDFDRGMY